MSSMPLLSVYLCVCAWLCFANAAEPSLGTLDGLLISCKVEDIDCLRESSQKFINATHMGIPEYDIEPTDPKVLPSLVLDFGDDVVKPRLTNVTVTGMKNQMLSQFIMHKNEKNVETLLMSMFNLTATSKFIIEFSNNTQYEVSISSLFNATLDTQYPYDLKIMDDGEEHFVVGEEITKCKKIDISSFHSIIQSKAVEYAPGKYIPEDNQEHVAFWKNLGEQQQHEDLLCDIVKAAYKSVMHNLKTVAKILPAKDILLNYKP